MKPLRHSKLRHSKTKGHSANVSEGSRESEMGITSLIPGQIVDGSFRKLGVP